MKNYIVKLHAQALVTIYLLALLVTTANANPLVSESKMAKFFKKNDKCLIAIGIYNPNYLSQPKTKSTKERMLVNLAFCINDMTSASGTIREKSGCGLAIYDVLQDTFSTPYYVNKYGKVWEDPAKTKGSDIPLAEGKDCLKGGFEELLSMYAGATWGGGTVRQAITYGTKHGMAEKILLYSGDSRLRNHWTQLVAQADEEASQKRARNKSAIAKINGLKQRYSKMTEKQLRNELCRLMKEDESGRAPSSQKELLQQQINAAGYEYAVKTSPGKKIEEGNITIPTCN